MKSSAWVITALTALLLGSIAFQAAEQPRPAWEYAELRIEETYPVTSYECKKLGMYVDVDVQSGGKGSRDKAFKEALEKIPGTGSTLQDKMGSEGWELVAVVEQFEVKTLKDQGILYHFKRRVR